MTFSKGATSAEISVIPFSQSKNFILIQGEIEKGDYEKFVNVVLEAGSNPFSVYIASNGGDASVAMEIGTLIRALKFKTQVPQNFSDDGAYCEPYLPIADSNCQCLSSCVLIYLAGIHRFGNHLGIHRTFVKHEYLRDLPMDDAKFYSHKISKTLDDYLTKMGAPKSLVEKIESISSEDIELLDIDFIDRYLDGYAKDYQEWVLAKCGSTTKLHKIIQSEKDDSKREEFVEEYHKVVRCESDLIKKESGAAYYAAIEQAFNLSDPALIPRHSLMESLRSHLPFDLTNLINMKNYEALDMLSLVGIPNTHSVKEIAAYNNATYYFDKSILVGFDTEGKVYRVNVNFYLSEELDLFDRHFLNGFNKSSTPMDFVAIYGKPSHAGCYPSDICFLNFTTSNADLEILFNEDKTLRTISVDTPGHWDKIYQKSKSSEIN